MIEKGTTKVVGEKRANKNIERINCLSQKVKIKRKKINNHFSQACYKLLEF